MLSRADLEGMKLAEQKPVTFKAADGTVIPAYLTLPPGSSGRNLPAIVMPHGGPASRDEWGFDWLVQFFAARGYAVLQPEFAARSGYGDDWFHEERLSVVADLDRRRGRCRPLAGRARVSPIRSKLAIFGWSYGGYAALQANVLDPEAVQGRGRGCAGDRPCKPSR